MVQSFEELCIMRVATVNFFARVLKPRKGRARGVFIFRLLDVIIIHYNGILEYRNSVIKMNFIYIYIYIYNIIYIYIYIYIYIICFIY